MSNKTLFYLALILSLKNIKSILLDVDDRILNNVLSKFTQLEQYRLLAAI